MMKSDEKYQVPAWMRPLLPLLCNTGGNDPEELLNDTETTASANVVRYVLIVAVRSQVDLLQLLYRKGLLRTEIPGGFSPEEAQALPAAWRHPVVRPDSDRQLLAHPPVSAEPAGAVSGCRYGPMSEKPGLQRPFRSRRPCRAGNGAPCTPDGV